MSENAIATPWEHSTGRHGFERETFEGPTQFLPELEIFGWLKFHVTLSGALEPDRHPDAFEIHYMVRGHLRWQIEQERHDFTSGRILIIHPNELHSGDEGSIQPCEHYWLRIRFPAKGSLPALTAVETGELRKAYERLNCRTFNASHDVIEFFKRLLEEHRHRQAVHAQIMARSTLHALLITILRDHNCHSHSLAVKRKPLLTWRVRRTMEWLEGKINQTDSQLDLVAANVGLSPAGLRVRFKEETGYTMHEYLMHRRLQEARRRLTETKDDITTIALDLGFSSSQYFATVFRQQIGTTPGDYRSRHHLTNHGKTA
jgi:AraC family transcriptional regulator, L-rhamnose operon regulatory protein RhaS